jgi:3'-5' exoribonuclease
MNFHVTRLASMANNLDVRPLANVVLDNPRFALWTGSPKTFQHHYGKGKLAQHTFEVAELCMVNYDCLWAMKGDQLLGDKPKLFLAALYHDVGKMWDFEPIDPEYVDWRTTVHKNKIYHITRSALVWSEAAKEAKWSQEETDEVLHAILSHHGRREWGSPVSPRDQMAWILHLCDSMSARVDDCLNEFPKHYS